MRIKIPFCLALACSIASCSDENEPVCDHYVIENSTGSWVCFDENISRTTTGCYMWKGEKFEFFLSTEYAGFITSNPDTVVASICLQDSVIEIVPRLMSDNVPYTMHSGLDQWMDHESTGDDLIPNVYTLTLTDEVLTAVAGRMRSNGRPPYKIAREEIVNYTSKEITITPTLGGTALAHISIAAGGTATLPETGLLFKCDKYSIAVADGTAETSKAFMSSFESHTFRDGDTDEGYRVYEIGSFALGGIFESQESE